MQISLCPFNVYVLVLTQAVSPGQQLVLSYGERSSDDFFVHYGFVPPLCNPKEVRGDERVVAVH